MACIEVRKNTFLKTKLCLDLRVFRCNLPQCPACGGAQENVPEVSRVTFDDVKGCTEAKAELEEVVEFLKSPTKFTRLGGRLPKGILLTGPPGTGRRPLASH